VFIIFPAAIGYILIMLVREAALLLLTATSPIAAGGLLSDGTRAWFWKSMRWFFATLLISPLAALVLGIGVQITEGTVEGGGDQTAAAVGMAVTGCILILIGAICPLILFRLLAFVDPGTSSGAAMRQTFAANGGVAGLLGGKAGGSGASSGSGAATQQGGGGRSAGEASADTQTASRFSSLLGGAGQAMAAGMGVAGTVGAKATAIGSDVLGAAGVGHQAPYFGPDGTGASDSGRGQINSSSSGGSNSQGGGSATPGAGASGDQNPDGGSPSGGSTPTPPIPAIPPTPGGGAGAGGGAAAGGAGSAGATGAAGTAGAVPVVPV
jgi:type IV secretion system protein TrbL